MERRISTMVISALFIVAIFAGCIGNDGTNSGSNGDEIAASIEQLLASKSERNAAETPVVCQYGKLYYSANETIDTDCKFYPLIATPISSFFDGSAMKMAPLLIRDMANPSASITNFLEVYNLQDPISIENTPANEISVALAGQVWKSSDAIMILPDSEKGYELGLMAVPIASYLNIPVVIGNASDAVKALGCKYAIAIGNASPCGLPTLRISDRDSIIKAEIEVCKAKLGGVSYITMSNPMDASPVIVISETIVLDETGTMAGTPPDPVSDAYGDPVRYDFELPEGIFIIEARLWFNATAPTEDLIVLSEGIHMGFYTHDQGDFADPDGGSLFYTDTQGYDYGAAYFEVDAAGDPGQHSVQLWGYGLSDKEYHLQIILKKLDRQERPQTPFASGVAPYLTAARGGIIVADPYFAANALGHIGCIDCGDFTEFNSEAFEAFNRANAYADAVLNLTLEMLADAGCLDAYMQTPYLCILADNNMLPMHYCEAQDRNNYELSGQPTDNVLGDTDGNENTLELASGRILGWDAQDVSALVARTLFYDSIIDSFDGPMGLSDWKSTAYLPCGADPQVALESIQKFVQTGQALLGAGYTVFASQGTTGAHYIAEDLLGEFSGSNIIYSLCHGRHYRYEYRSYKMSPYRQATQMAVLNVKDMKLGPSAMFVTTCLGGTTDGFPLRTSTLATFLHAGVNAMLAPTRCPNVAIGVDDAWALALNKLAVDEVALNGCTMGMAARNAKNAYAAQGLDYLCWEEFTHYTLYGDPAFKPYVP